MKRVGDISTLQHNYDTPLPGVLDRHQDMGSGSVGLGNLADNGKPGGRFRERFRVVG